jgi:hypothetical protein
MGLDLPVAEICESVLIAILDLVVLEAWIFDGLEEMNRLWQ